MLSEKRTSIMPEWLTETPCESEYTLEMYESGDDRQICDSVSMTRSEYLQLKVHLAEMRGVSIPSELKRKLVAA